MTNNINEYLHQLPPEVQLRSNELLPKVLEIVTAWRRKIEDKADEELADLDKFVFTPIGTHPEYEDMEQVFSRAFEELALRQPQQPNEIPLLFIGYHSMVIVTSKRQSLGLLLTDQTLYLQDKTSFFSFVQDLPRFDALPSDTLAAREFVRTHFSRFPWNEDMVEPKEREELQQLLTEVVSVLIDHHRMHGSLVDATKVKSSFQALVRSLALQDVVEDASKPKSAKTLAKVSSKFEIPAEEKIIFAVIDTPLFGGPYGFAVTRNNLYTRDAMEAPQTIPLSEISADGTLRLTDDEKNLITSTEQIIFLPMHLKTSSVKQLIPLILGTIELIQGGSMVEH